MTKKLTSLEIAKNTFAQNKELDTVFIVGGYPFSTENAANLHKNTSGKKGMKVVSFSRKEAAVVAPKKSFAEKAAKLAKLNKPELIKVAESKGLRPDENVTKAQIISQIEAVETNKIEE